ncbi:hypothetical protein CTAYLR_004014 [Chrysophaeum taylorii]|uniref:Endonuclease/exonuclease/phosphatase domain-containing protein n=1 Tax=Chrysophaeum taylorii TaxID=2483200 RepID=A0AAD7U7N3_9STRA|nr:hypothetical protein CTAYLR_004014 [Chrysophaeum taylorii]
MEQQHQLLLEMFPGKVDAVRRALERGKDVQGAVEILLGESSGSSDDLAAIRRLRAEEYQTRTKRTIDLTEEAEEPQPLEVVSYNVWFEEPPSFAVRMAAIGRLCATARVVGFQEVTEDSEKLLRASLPANFRFARQRTPAPYYCLLAGPGLLSSRTVPFHDTIMGRGVLLGRVERSAADVVVVGVTHLESFVKGVEGVVREARAKQAVEAQEAVEAEVKATSASAGILIGDTNWNESDDGEFPLRAGWKDAWQGDEATRYTYDGKANPMLRHKFRHRYDRILAFGRDRVGPLRLLGTEPVGGTLVRHNSKVPMAPSDHFGVAATLLGHHDPPPTTKKKSTTNWPRSSSSSSSYRGALVPAPFRLVEGTLLVAEFNGPPLAEATKLAGFDFDGTLADRDFRRKDHWAHVYPHIPKALASLSKSHKIAVLTNESVDHLKNSGPIANALNAKCGRLRAWAAALKDVPVLVLVALSKKTCFHKSKGSGMWTKAVADLKITDTSASFFVGDSDDDRNLARLADVRYHDTHAFFPPLK